MELLISVLERRNLCLKSFHKLCERFLDEISAGRSDGLEEFQRKRQSLIHVLEGLEKESGKALEAYGSHSAPLDAMIDDETKGKIADLFKSKDSTIKSIVDLDLQILAHIDRIKNETIQKLNALQGGRKTLSAYRSPLERVEKAEITGRIDREA